MRFTSVWPTFTGYKIRNWRMRARIRLWTMRAAATGQADPAGLGVEEAFLVALRNYTPEPYEGDATLFRAKDDFASYSDPTLGWGRLIQGRLEIREISGDHDTILHEPHIGMLARVLDSCLHAVQASARGMQQCGSRPELMRARCTRRVGKEGNDERY